MGFVSLGVYKFSKNRKLPLQEFKIALPSYGPHPGHKVPFCCESSSVSSPLLLT